MKHACGDRKGKKTRHISVTDTAGNVYRHLLLRGFIAHPGPITTHGGSGPKTRITLTTETNRCRISVSNSGTQELFLYGKCDQQELESALRTFVGNDLKVRNTTITK